MVLNGRKGRMKKKLGKFCNVNGPGGTFIENNIVAKIYRILYEFPVKKCDKVFFQNTGDRDLFIRYNMVKDNYERLPGLGINFE